MQADMRPDKAATRSPKAGHHRSPFRITPQVILGILIMGFGIVLMADNLGLTDARRILRFWPLGLVLVGTMKLFRPDGRSGRVSGGLLLLVGLGFTAEIVLGWPIDFDEWWPVVLIAFGIVILTRARTPWRHPDTPVTQDQRVSEFAFWSGKQRRVATPEFRHADLTALMGGVEFDLRGAATATGEAVLDVFAMWGGIEITVPPDWAVSNEVTVVMGGVEDNSSGTQDAKHRLIVRGFVVMGGLEIKT